MGLPHHYTAAGSVKQEGNVEISSGELPRLQSAAPADFGGPGDLWSPEDLLVAAVADCFVLAFRAIARASKYEWIELTCSVTGTLDKVERATQFTEFAIQAKLTVSAAADQDRANRLLEKAEQTCFVTNSLKATPKLETEIIVA
jgi:organic hydroperoxide reductase OsmC/OhrA